MKLIHAADLHAKFSSYDDFLTSIEHIAMAAQNHEVGLIALSGDIWDGPVQNAAGSLFPEFLEAIRSLADIAPVAMIYGTPSHDVEGSLEVFESLEAVHTIKILRPGIAYALLEGRIVELGCGNEEKAECMLFGFPEPSYRWLLASGEQVRGNGVEPLARDALHTLCLATGCMREKYPRLPCVVLAHGHIEGAMMGKTARIEPGRGLAFSKDDLKALKADYIAFGDIHEPQHIEGTRAWYSGSIYPINFGETHQAGCWEVRVKEPGAAVDVERVAFPHPLHRHLISSEECAYEVPGMHGERLWYEIRCTRQEAARIDTDEILSRLLGHGAAQGSKVTLTIKPEEAIRSAEITEAASFEKKLEIWAKNVEEPLRESALEKARQLCLEVSRTNPAAGNAHFRVDRLILRGAIGTWKKSRKDEVELDLASQGPGVIALTGRNGEGKTTLLENLHPWPRLLTRDGALKYHFRLPDSFRDLYLTDTLSGYRYRCLIRIRADIPSGSCEYWLFRDTGTGFAPLPGINGRLEPYSDWVKRLFGTLELYARTAFISQSPPRGIPAIGEATKGERKLLFGELAGIRWLDTYRQAAKDRADSIQDEKRLLDAQLKTFSTLDATITKSEKELEERRGAVANLGTKIEALAERVREAENLEETRKDQLVERERLVRERERGFNDFQKAKGRERGQLDEIEVFRASLRRRADAQNALSEYEALSAQQKHLQNEAGAIDAINRKASREYAAAFKEYGATRDQRARDLDTARKEAGVAEAQVRSLADRIREPVSDHCPECGQILPPDILKGIKEGIERMKVELEANEAELKAARGTLSLRSETLANLKAPIMPRVLEFEYEAKLVEISERLAQIDIKGTLETISRAKVAEEHIAKARAEVVKIEKEISKASEIQEGCTEKIAALDATLKSTSKGDTLPALKAKLEALKDQHAREDERIAAVSEQIEGLKRNLETKANLQEKATSLASDMEDWRLLERAAGQDGIQALELDALAPSIAETATQLLLASGNQGRIEIRTTKLGGKGKEQHQIEDFLILFIDPEGNEQEISTLSGGESVWIRKAVYDAFEVVRARSTGLQFLTIVLDEADGALDPESRMNYLRMIEEAHRESGRYQTIIITHSLELQSMAATCIAMESLGPAESKQEEKEELLLSA